MTSMWDWDADTRSRLGAFLTRNDLCGPDVSTILVGDGHSNLTYLVDDGERRLIVRRPPPPPTPPGAHDMLREARILQALEPSGLPVPRVLATADAGEVLDVPLYAMTYAVGPIVTTETPGALAEPAIRREVGHALIDALALLHDVDWTSVGGKPDGFNARHLAALSRLVPDPPTPDFGRLGEWLAAEVPAESGAAVLHNDFRIGNVVLAPTPPGRIAAILDWELAAIGDPLFDLGYFLGTVPDGDDLTATQALSTALLEPGYPTRAELTERYARRTGRDVGGLAWYVALAQWKLAVLYEYQRRKATDPYYADPQHVAGFVRAGLRAAGLREEQP